MLCLRDSIRDDDPSVQHLLCAGEDASARTALILAAWQVARVLAVHMVDAVRAERARDPTSWPPCPACGTPLERKGLAPRQGTRVRGSIRWRRRVGRCPQGCDIPQGVPVDEALGVQPQQRTRGALQHLGWAVAVCVPCATAATLLGWASGVAVRPRAVWAWVHAAGQRALAHLHAPWQAAAEGPLPPEEPLAAALAALPVARGADGVRVPCRPAGGQPRGTTAWHEVTVGMRARVGRQRTRTGAIVARLPQRRLVAVFGDIEALQDRVWLEALRQGLRRAPQVVWRREGARGLWRLCAERFTASATGIVDLSPAVHQRWKGAAAWLDGRTSKARRGCSWARHRLRHGHPDGVLADVADAVEVEGVPDTARDTVRAV